MTFASVYHVGLAIGQLRNPGEKHCRTTVQTLQLENRMSTTLRSDRETTGPGSDQNSARACERPGRDELFFTYEKPLRRFFIRRLGPHAEIDDLVQEVFYRIFALGKQDQLENPQAYIFQVAANLIRDRARRTLTKHELSRHLATENETRVEEISPERVLQGKQAVAVLRNALEELPQRTRAVFVLHRFEGFKYREIAKRLGISPSSVEKHMMAAIKHVLERMGQSDVQN